LQLLLGLFWLTIGDFVAAYIALKIPFFLYAQRSLSFRSHFADVLFAFTSLSAHVLLKLLTFPRFLGACRCQFHMDKAIAEHLSGHLLITGAQDLWALMDGMRYLARGDASLTLPDFQPVFAPF
jgi:hypothetical protein